MTAITGVLAVPGTGAGYYEDRAALRARRVALPMRFEAPGVTPGFRAVREVAETVSVGLVLGDAQSVREAPDMGGGRWVAWGDCAAVSYSGTAGRDPLFRSAEGLDTIQEVVAPFLVGQEVGSFRQMAAHIEALTEEVEVERPVRRAPARERPPRGTGISRRALLTAAGRALRDAGEEVGPPAVERVRVARRVHTAVRYGVSQALLRAAAIDRGVTMAEVVAAEWGLPLPEAPVRVHAQSGHERYYNAEKMIVRRIASLPHALVDDIPEQIGEDGNEMTRYIRWLAERIGTLGGRDYRPTIHLDLHGALGAICENDAGRMLGQLYAWERAAEPYRLRIESPMVRETRQAQIDALRTLRDYVRFRKMTVELVADEWANTLDDIRAFVAAGAADMIQVKMPDLGGLHNTVDAVLACQEASVGVLLGGSYAETDLSSRIAAHVALATRPDLIMARPGMGVDEAVSLIENEMARALAEIGCGKEGETDAGD